MENHHKVARVKCQQSLLFHTRYFFKKNQGRKFILNQHHYAIADALEAVLRGDIKRLIINVAPRYTKTELAVKNFIGHGLSLNPRSKYIHLSYGDDIALDNSESIKDTLQSEEYRLLFPEIKIKKDAKAKDKWYTEQGGGVLARSAGGQVTGFGAGLMAMTEEERKRLEREEMDAFSKEIDEFFEETGITVEETNLDVKWKFNGAIIIDDPIKPEDADQDTVREKINHRFDSTIRNRVNDRDTPIIVIMQRLHPMDLSGYLQRDSEADKWTVLSLPCIQQDGTALWPFKHSIEELKALRKANELVFERQYQQNPKPKAGLMFPEDELHFFNPLEVIDSERLYVYVPVDPANLGGDDFAAITAVLRPPWIDIEDVLYNTEGADFNEPEVVKMVIRNGAHECGVEGVFGWEDSVKNIAAELEKKGWEGDVRNLRPRTAKHVRISARQSFIRNHFRFRSDYVDHPQYLKFMNNLTSYKKIQEAGSKNKHDEAPDVCEMAAGKFQKEFPELWPISP